MWGGFDPSWTVEDVKAGDEETSPIYVTQFYGAVKVYSNTINLTQGAILFFNDAPTQSSGSEIYNNLMVDTYGSAMEIENFAYKVKL